MDILYFYWYKLLALADLHNFPHLHLLIGIVVWGLLLFAVIIRITYKVFYKSRLRHLHQKHKNSDRDISFQIPEQQHRDFLEMRSEELRRDVERMAADARALAVLESERQVLAKQRANPEKALQELKKRLALVHSGLNEFRDDLPVAQIAQAQVALEAGDTGMAAAVLKLALERKPEREGEACYQLGILAETRLDYLTAAQYYARAAKVQSHNLSYLLPASEFAFFIGNYEESENYLRKALEIKEKAFGPEHPEIAQILHHLAATYFARERYVEAEALYQWSLEIEENSREPDRSRLAATLKEYTALLRKMGRDSDAAAMEERAAAVLALPQKAGAIR